MNQLKSKQASVKTAGQWRLLDGERPAAVIDSWDRLQDALTNITRSTPPNRIVDLESPQGDVLSFGIAGLNDADNPGLTETRACLQFTESSRNPPYLAVVGNAALTFENGGVIIFRYDGSWTEILRRNCVPIDDMLDVVKHFFSTGTLPNSMIWEAV